MKNDFEDHKWLYALILGLGNAADAVEIMCVGFIMNEIETTTYQKGVSNKFNFKDLNCLISPTRIS